MEEKKIAKVSPMLSETKAKEDSIEETLSTLSVASQEVSDTASRQPKEEMTVMAKSRQELISSTIEYYTSNNPEHIETLEELTNFYDHFFDFFDLLLAQNGLTKMMALIEWMLHFGPYDFGRLWPKLMNLFVSLPRFEIHFYEPEDFDFSKIAYISR